MTAPLFRRLLGPAIETLPPSLRAAHDNREDQRWTGRARVDASRNPLARLLCRMMRLPAPGSDVAVIVIFKRTHDGERWLRDFAGRRYRSTLTMRHSLMVEWMGPATNVFRIAVADGALRLDLVGFRFLGLPLPARLRPRCHATEREQEGCYAFDVPIDLPGLGRIIRYTGRLERRHD